jgi:hypothetical protein
MLRVSKDMKVGKDDEDCYNKRCYVPRTSMFGISKLTPSAMSPFGTGRAWTIEDKTRRKEERAADFMTKTASVLKKVRKDQPDDLLLRRRKRPEQKST